MCHGKGLVSKASYILPLSPCDSQPSLSQPLFSFEKSLSLTNCNLLHGSHVTSQFPSNNLAQMVHCSHASISPSTKTRASTGCEAMASFTAKRVWLSTPLSPDSDRMPLGPWQSYRYLGGPSPTSSARVSLIL